MYQNSGVFWLYYIWLYELNCRYNKNLYPFEIFMVKMIIYVILGYGAKRIHEIMPDFEEQNFVAI